MDHLIKPYLEFILRALRYPHAIVQNNGDQLICGFTSNSLSVQKELELFVKPKAIHKDGNNYLVIFSKDSISKVLMKHFKRILDNIIAQRELKGARIVGDYNQKYGFLLKDKAAFDAVIQTSCTDLHAAGLGYSHWSESTIKFQDHFTSIHNNPLLHFAFTRAHNLPLPHLALTAILSRPQPLNRREIYKLFVPISSEDLFFINSLTEVQKTLLQETHAPINFLMGTHFRAGEKSEVRKLNRDLVPYLYSFIPEEKLPENEQLYSAISKKNKQPERKIDLETNLNNKINARILQLSNEIESFFSLNEDRKNQKIEFLKLIQVFKKANPGLSYGSCLAFAKEENPALFNAACAGGVVSSSATKKLLDEITGPQLEHKKSGPKSVR